MSYTNKLDDLMRKYKFECEVCGNPCTGKTCLKHVDHIAAGKRAFYKRNVPSPDNKLLADYPVRQNYFQEKYQEEASK